MTRKNRFDDGRTALLRAQLEGRRRELLRHLRSLREDLPAEALGVRDTEEQCVDDLVQEMDLALMQMKSETLAKIDDALRRLRAQGPTAACAASARPRSPAARLKALPFADRCRDCQEALESEQREARAAAPAAGPSWTVSCSPASGAR